MIYFKENITLPSLPLVFEKTLVAIQKNQNSCMAHYYSGQGELKFKQIPDVIYSWVNENICDDYTGLGVQSIERGDFDPHIDGRDPTNLTERQFTLLYVIDPGTNVDGHEPYTRFYQIKSGKSTFYTNSYNNKLYHRSDVNMIGQCQFKKRTWNLINNQVIHSVDNIKSTRICLAISFFDTKPESLIKLGLL